MQHNFDHEFDWYDIYVIEQGKSTYKSNKTETSIFKTTTQFSDAIYYMSETRKMIDVVERGIVGNKIGGGTVDRVVLMKETNDDIVSIQDIGTIYTTPNRANINDNYDIVSIHPVEGGSLEADEITLRVWYNYESRAQKLTVPRIGDVGIDLKTPIDFAVQTMADNKENGVQNLHCVKIHTGVHIELPPGYYARIDEKSSVAADLGVIVLGGIIDNSYRGDIIVALANISSQKAVFKAGQKIAQLIVSPYTPVTNLEEVTTLEELEETERGQGGFGSTGKF